MVWGFRSRSSQLVALHQAMGRIINRSFSVQELCPELLDSGEKRSESRAKRTCPVIVFGPGDSDEFATPIVAFTHDLSLNGVAILSTCRLPVGESVLVIGDANSRILVAAKCLSCTPRELGCYFSAYRLSELLNPNKHIAHMDIVRQIEHDCCSTLPASDPMAASGADRWR